MLEECDVSCFVMLNFVFAESLSFYWTWVPVSWWLEVFHCACMISGLVLRIPLSGFDNGKLNKTTHLKKQGQCCKMAAYMLS